jgi:hypothetical protein
MGVEAVDEGFCRVLIAVVVDASDSTVTAFGKSL